MPSSDFRIPNQMLVNNSLSALQESFAKLADLQDQASSLKRVRATPTILVPAGSRCLRNS